MRTTNYLGVIEAMEQRIVRRCGPSRRESGGFTLLELVMVIAVLALATLVLSQHRTGTASKLKCCASNYREWAVAANLYASDCQGALPRFDAPMPRMPVNVGSSMISVLSGYGLTVSSWFCPMRPMEIEKIDAAYRIAVGRSIQNLQDVSVALGQGLPGNATIPHNYWVPRVGARGLMFPKVDVGEQEWPRKISDASASLVPFVSDECFADRVNWPDVPHINPETGHFAGNKFLGVNLSFADGHVSASSEWDVEPRYSMWYDWYY